ncbi:MAG TPA: PAS domain-containing sensor histidine kinase [Kofleriaceae bacterium]|nr:PAS domain-containing sensor histidine kinase [Kofleriaceae bacterium]
MTDDRAAARAAPTLSALLDALSRARIGVVVFFRRGTGMEKWLANDAALEPLGYSEEDWLATPAFGLIAPTDRPRVAELYERVMTGTEPPAIIELTLIHRDGRELKTEFTAGRANTPEGMVLVLLSRGASKATAALLEADRISLVGALAAGFAHETNNPLTSVLLNLRSLRKQLIAHLDGETQSAAVRCLDDITTGAERIASNVRALQTLATRSMTQSLDLAAIVAGAVRLAAPTLEPRAHVVRQIFPVRPVLGEESRIGQAVLAMLLFSSSGFADSLASASTSNRIVIAVEERGGVAVVEVSDNGRGLANEDVAHAFDPFFRSPVRGSSIGVGLGVARSVAVTLGGDVVLASRDGGGAVITMKLPLAAASPPALPA